MYQVNSLEIKGEHIRLYLEEDKVRMLQDLVDEMSVMATLLGYEIKIDNELRNTYSTITFEKLDNAVGIYFQHASQKTTCYCIHNGEHVSINKLKKLL